MDDWGIKLGRWGSGKKSDMRKKSSGRRTRRLFNSEFKAKVALAALREDKKMIDRDHTLSMSRTSVYTLEFL